MHACRTCLSRYELTPLFGELSVVKFSSDQLFSATGIKIEPNDGLPQTSCRPCIKRIKKALDFREISSKVDQMLRNLMIKNDTVIKTEKNDIDNISAEFQTVNIISSSEGDTGGNDVSFDLNDEKECCDTDSDSCSNDSISLAKYKELIDTKHNTKHKKTGLTAEMKASNNSDTDNQDIDNSDNDNDNTYLAKFEEVYTKPVLEFSIIDRKSNTDDLLITDDQDNFKISSNQHNKDFEDIFKTFTTKPSKIFKIPIPKKKIKSKVQLEVVIKPKTKLCNLQFDAPDISEEDKASGRISNVRIEDILSKEAMDEIFDSETCEKDAIKPKLDTNNDITMRRDIPRSIPSLVNYRYRNYFKQMRQKDMEHIARRKDTGDAVMRQYIGVDRRSDEAKARDKKLMSLAVTPHPRAGPVRCRLCGRRVRSVLNFKTHAKTHFDPEFSCDSCGKKFTSRSHMGYHQQRMHGREKRLACPHCAFRAVDRLTLRNHERASHTGERPYICAECGAAFRMRNNLIQHLKMHFGVKNIQCELCPSLFSRRNQLWNHQMKVHFMTYTYHCYLCPETYKGLRPVKNHLLNVHAVPEDQQLKIKCVKTRKEEAAGTSVGPTSAEPQRRVATNVPTLVYLLNNNTSCGNN